MIYMKAALIFEIGESVTGHIQLIIISEKNHGCCYFGTLRRQTSAAMISDFFMSDLYSQLRHLTWEFQTLQLIVLAVFGAVD